MKHLAPISGISTHMDKYIATAGYDNKVILWNAHTKRPIHRVFHDHLANQCSFNSTGSLLVSASSDYSARIWEVPSMRLKMALLGHEDDVEMAAFNPSGEIVATCSRDHTIRLFDAISGKCLHILRGHRADVISVGWASDGNSVISSSDDGTIRRWDALRGKQTEVVDLDGVETDTIALASNGTIFAGDDEGCLTFIKGQEKHRFQAHAAGIKRIVWDDKKKWLISLSYDRSVVLWREANGKLEKISESSLPSIIWPRSCAFLGEQKIAFATFGSTFGIWEHATGEWDVDEIENTVSLNAVVTNNNNIYAIGDAGLLLVNGQPKSIIGSLCNFLLPLGSAILTGGQMGQVFDAISGKLLHQHRSPLNCGTVFVRNSRTHAAIGTYTGEALIFSLNESNDVIYQGEIRMHNNAIKGIAADEEYLFSVCATAAAAFYRISDYGKHIYIENAHERISNACATIYGGFASVGRDLKLRLWRPGGNDVFDTPHLHSIKCIATTPDRKLIATGSYGGTVALFDIESKCWVSQLKPTASGISCIVYSEADKAFIASSYDGKLYPIRQEE